jgi:hypothetical protein
MIVEMGRRELGRLITKNNEAHCYCDAALDLRGLDNRSERNEQQVWERKVQNHNFKIFFF